MRDIADMRLYASLVCQVARCATNLGAEELISPEKGGGGGKAKGFEAGCVRNMLADLQYFFRGSM